MNPPFSWEFLYGSIFGFMKKDEKVIHKDKTRQSKKECLGVRYSVKNADNIDPQIPPIATRDQA